jgi:DNA-binding NarL/FixJ family response regulator
MQKQPHLEVCGEAVYRLDGIDKALASRPDLIPLDLAMPEMNGAEAASVLKSRLPNVPVVLFTMYTEYVGHKLTSAVGVDLVLSKPEGMSDLLSRVQELLDPPCDEDARGFSAPGAAN